MKKKYHLYHLISNENDDLLYIGITSDTEQRLKTHKSAFFEDYNFRMEIQKSFNSLGDAHAAEIKQIKKFSKGSKLLNKKHNEGEVLPRKDNSGTAKISETQLNALKELKENTGRPIQYMIRAAIDEYLASDKPVK